MSNSVRWWPLLAAVVVVVVVVLATPAVIADVAADALRPHVGKTLDVVELGTGRRFVRPTLAQLEIRGGRTEALRIVEEGQRRTTTLTLRGISKVVVDRETVYEADSAAVGAAGVRGRAVRERRARELAESEARMRARGVAAWPQLSAEDHAAEVARLEAFVKAVQTVFPALELHQTHEFLVATDIPVAETGPYLASLDSLHDLLCDLYDIPRGEPLWKGKCLVVAFRREDDFHAFEGRFMGSDVPRGVHGLCHQSSDGRVVMACHRGRDLDAFAHMLVHETSHGFNHRWISPERLPNWLNEGLAEWVGTQVVPRSRQVPAKEARALAFMQQTGALGPEFFTAPNIQPIQYGIASQLVRFLVARDRRKFGEFVRGVKEGMTVEESLAAAYRGSLTDLLAAFGKAIGVPGLAP